MANITLLWPSNTLRILDDFLFVARFNIHRFWILLLLSNAPELSSPTIGRIGEGLIGGRAVNIRTVPVWKTEACGSVTQTADGPSVGLVSST